MNNTFLIVIFQILLIWGVVIIIYVRTSRRDGRAPIDDIGVLWLGIFALYTTIPPISWLFQGCEYSPFAGRLFLAQPDGSEIISLLNIGLAYLLGFAMVYMVLLKRVNKPSVKAQAHISSAKMKAALLIVLIASLCGFVIDKMGLIRAADSYMDSYSAIAELPLGLRQLLKLIGAFSSVATLIFLIALLQRWPHYYWLLIFYALSLLNSINPEGSRTGVATGLFGIVLAWHVLIRPIKTRWVLAGGSFGLLVFLVLGIIRNYGSLNGAGDQGLGVVGFGEFDSIWANAVELFQSKQNSGIVVPFAARFGEFFSFIPSQFLWFDKFDLPNWYLDTYYPFLKEQGGGLAFGIISQAIIGGGIFEAAIRGMILGVLIGKIMKWVRMPTNSWWRFPLHLYILISVYQLIRYSTFSIWGNIVQTVIPTFIVIAIIGSLIKSFSTKNHKIPRDIHCKTNPFES